MRWEVQNGQINRVSFRKMKTAIQKTNPDKHRDDRFQKELKCSISVKPAILSEQVKTGKGRLPNVG